MYGPHQRFTGLLLPCGPRKEEYVQDTLRRTVLFSGAPSNITGPHR